MYLQSSDLGDPKNQSRVGTYESILREKKPLRGPLQTPEFKETERWYMVKVTSLSDFPPHIIGWKRAVASMLSQFSICLSKNLPAYVTIDYRHVNAGNTHRRGGLHVDGNWIEIYSEGINVSEHGAKKETYSYLRGIGNVFPFKYSPETILLYTNTSACIGYTGTFTGEILDDGDCSLIDTTNMQEVPLLEHVVYAGNETFLHESVPVFQDCTRFLIRIVIPGLVTSTLAK